MIHTSIDRLRPSGAPPGRRTISRIGRSLRRPHRLPLETGNQLPGRNLALDANEVDRHRRLHHGIGEFLPVATSGHSTRRSPRSVDLPGSLTGRLATISAGISPAFFCARQLELLAHEPTQSLQRAEPRVIRLVQIHGRLPRLTGLAWLLPGCPGWDPLRLERGGTGGLFAALPDGSFRGNDFITTQNPGSVKNRDPHPPDPTRPQPSLNRFTNAARRLAQAG